MHSNSERPRISVLGASYNHVNFLSQAVQSILNQEGPSFELILIDDASTDGTQDILKGISDPRVRTILRETNQGVCRTFNEAFSHARGEYIAFMPGDDVFLPHKLAIQAAYLDEHPATVAVFSLMRPIDDTGRQIQNSLLQKAYLAHPNSRIDVLRMAFLGHNCLFAPTEMLRREAIASEPYFYDIRCSQGQDWEQHVRVALKGEIAVIPKPLVHYRMHDNNVSKASPAQAACLSVEHDFVLDNFLRMDDPILFRRTFPELVGEHNPTAEHMPYLLARAAIGTQHARLKQWGLRVLGGLLSTDGKARRLEKATGFTLKDYYALQRDVGRLGA